MGYVYTEMPRPQIWKPFQERHDLYMVGFIDESEESMMYNIERQEKRRKKQVVSSMPLEKHLQSAMPILPEILDSNKAISKGEDHGRLDIKKMKRIFEERMGVKLAPNKSYDVRDAVLERLHADNDAILKKYVQKSESNDEN